MKNKKMLAAIFFLGILTSRAVGANPLENIQEKIETGEEDMEVVINSFESLKKEVYLFLYDVDKVVNWAMLNIAVKNLDPKEFAEIYSEKTVDLIIEFRNELRKAKDLYEKTTSLVYSWTSFAAKPLKWLKDHLPNESEAQVGDKLVKILKLLMTKAIDKFRSAEKELQNVQRHLSLAKKKFEQFQASASEDYKNMVKGSKGKTRDKRETDEMRNRCTRKIEIRIYICLQAFNCDREKNPPPSNNPVPPRPYQPAQPAQPPQPRPSPPSVSTTTSTTTTSWPEPDSADQPSLDRLKNLHDKYNLLVERMKVVEALLEKTKVKIVEEERLIREARSKLDSLLEISEIIGDDREQVIDKIQLLELTCTEYQKRHAKAAEVTRKRRSLDFHEEIYQNKRFSP